MRKKIKLTMRITGWFQALTPGQRVLLPYVILTVAVFAAYANAFHNAFVWDDWHLIVYNEVLRHWSGIHDILLKNTLGPYYRPVQALLYLIVYQMFGLSEPAFHSLNVLLQAANVCLMYRLGCRLGFYPRASFAAALLWGVHPIGIEAAAVIAGTADLLVPFFCMLGILVLLPGFTQQKTHAPKTNIIVPRKLGLALVFFLLALCSKESAIVFPALASFSLFLVSKERLRPATYIRTWPLWLFGIAYIIGWLLCPALNNGFAGYLIKDIHYTETYEHNFLNRVLTCLATLPAYLSLIVMPVKLRVAWDFPIFKTLWDWQVIAGMVIAGLALLQIIWGHGKRALPLTFGLLWFAAAFSPYSGILKAIDGRFSEHWVYFSTIGLFLGLCQTVVLWTDRLHPQKRSKNARAILTGLVIAATVAFGTETHLQNKILRDPASLFEAINAENPTVWSHYELGVIYFGQKRYEEAEEQWHDVEADNYRIFLNRGGALFMHNSLAYIYLGVLSADKTTISLPDIMQALPSSKHIPEAIAELKAAEDVDPHYCCASTFLAGIYYYLGDKDKADYYKSLTEKNAPTNELQNPGQFLPQN